MNVFMKLKSRPINTKFLTVQKKRGREISF